MKAGGDGEADFGVSSGTITFELQCSDCLSLASTGIDGVGGFPVGIKNSSMDNLHQSTPNRICWSTSQDRYPFSGSHPSLRMQLVHLVLKDATCASCPISVSDRVREGRLGLRLCYLPPRLKKCD